MRKLLIALFLLFCITHLCSAQSETVEKQTIRYSESKSYQPRQFPVKKDQVNSKKDKKSKKKEQEANNIQNAQLMAAPLPIAKDSAEPSSPKLIDKTITIPVSVFSSSGYFVTNLTQSDFKVFADGQEQQILEVTKRNEPISLVLLVDTSPSTAFRIEEIQKYAQAIVDKLQPEDKVMIIAFNEQTQVLSELTTDRRTTAKAIGKLKFGDGTSLYEAVENTFDKYVNQISGLKTVILLTDGVDTTSRRSNYKESLLKVEQSDTAVFPIYFDTLADSIQPKKLNNNNARILGSILGGIQGIQIGKGAGATEAEYELGRMYLNDISVLSGGRPRQVKDIKDIKAENIDNISLELKAQYQISFRPTDFAVGQRKQIVVRVNRPDLFVQARGSLLP
jgi:VWFA-related protein